MTNLQDKIVINGVDVTTRRIKWKVKKYNRDKIASAQITFTKKVSGVISIQPGQSVTIQRGFTTATDYYVFRGRVSRFKEEGALIIIECKDKMWDAVNAEVTHTYDGAIDFSANNTMRGDEIWDDLMNTYAGLTTSVVSTGTTLYLNKFVCDGDDPFERGKELCDLYDYQQYYDPINNYVRFEPVGNTSSGETLTVGTEIVNKPKWNEDTSQLCNYLTIIGAKQEVETTEYFDANGSTTEFQLGFVPVSVKAYTSVSGAWVLKTGGIATASSSYDYTVDDNPDERKIKFSTAPPNDAATTPNDLRIDYSYLINIPILVRDDASILAYGGDNATAFKKRITKTEIKSVADAEIFAQKYLAAYKEPFLSTEIWVVNKIAVNVGEQLVVTDTSVNNRSGTFVITEVEYSFPYRYDKLKIVNKDLKLRDIDEDVAVKIKQLNDQLKGKDDVVINIVDFSHKHFHKRSIIETYSRDLTGNTELIFNHATFGEWNAYNWGKRNDYVIERPWFDFEDADGRRIQDKSSRGVDGWAYGPEILWLQFEEGDSFNAYDVSDTTTHCYIVGPAWDAGKVGSYCLLFDGVDDYVFVGTGRVSVTDAWSINLWVKFSSVSGQQCFFSLGPTSGNVNRIFFGKNTSHKLYLYKYGSGSTLQTCVGDTTLAIDTWYHIVGTYDGTNLKIYLNGAEDTPYVTSGSTEAMTSTSRYAVVGAYHTTHIYNLNGFMDDFRVTDNALSSANVTELYNSGGGMKKPVGVFAGSGIVGSNALECDDANNYVRILPDGGGIVNEWSICLWVNPDNVAGGKYIVHYKESVGDENEIAIIQAAGGKIRADVYDSGGTLFKNYTGNTAMSNGNDYWICVTWNGTDLKIYLNNSEDTPYTKTQDDAVTQTDTERVRFIGAETDDTSHFDGTIDDFRVYNYEISSANRTSIYNSGSGLTTSLRGFVRDFRTDYIGW